MSAGEAEGKRLGTEFSIRHTENWVDRVADAEEGAQGSACGHRDVPRGHGGVRRRPGHAADRERALPARARPEGGERPAGSRPTWRRAYTPRVQQNVEKAEGRARRSSTAVHPGRSQADGLRPAPRRGRVPRPRPQGAEGRHEGRRSLLRDEPAKARLTPLIRDIVRTLGTASPRSRGGSVPPCRRSCPTEEES